MYFNLFEDFLLPFCDRFRSIFIDSPCSTCLRRLEWIDGFFTRRRINLLSNVIVFIQLSICGASHVIQRFTWNVPDFTSAAVEASALDFRIQKDLEFVDELDDDELDGVGRS